MTHISSEEQKVVLVFFVFFTARLLQTRTREEQWDWSRLSCDIKGSRTKRREEKPPRARSHHGRSACDEPEE